MSGRRQVSGEREDLPAVLERDEFRSSRSSIILSINFMASAISEVIPPEAILI